MLKIAIYGGTFDPVHKGHIATAISIQKSFHFDRFYFLPCKDPLLKPKALASANDRIQMLELALKNYSQFQLDLREIQRDTPSRMVETLESFRREYTGASITLILGMDAFLSLPQWYEWKKLTSLSHLIIMTRPGFQLNISSELQHLLAISGTVDRQLLMHTESGYILQMDAGYFDIASSDIRQRIQQGLNAESMLDTNVLEYIQQNGLYLT